MLCSIVFYCIVLYTVLYSILFYSKVEVTLIQYETVVFYKSNLFHRCIFECSSCNSFID